MIHFINIAYTVITRRETNIRNSN